MAKQLHILSTLTNDMRYCRYKKAAPGQPPQVDASVVIHGKAGLPGKNLHTPRGVSTPVTSEELELLQANRVFQKHAENGFVTILATDPRDADKAAADQNEGDGARQLTPGDMQTDEAGKVSVKPAAQRKARGKAAAEEKAE